MGGGPAGAAAAWEAGPSRATGALGGGVDASSAAFGEANRSTYSFSGVGPGREASPMRTPKSG